MKILILRHGDPDYVHDSLTEKGRREAIALANRLTGEKIDAIYCSPLGRAKLTCSYTLGMKNMSAETCDWLQEFQGKSRHLFSNGEMKETHCWDYLPSDMVSDPAMLTPTWYKDAVTCQGYNAEEKYNYVITNLDALLEEHGYKREGLLYKAIRPNHDTIALFCHFGVEGIMLSHLLNIPAPQILNNMMGLPCSYTSLYTEERQEGIAIFRMNTFGDVSHITATGEPASFAGRFVECFTDEGRHD